MVIRKDLGVKEILLIIGLAGALYGGIQGVQAIAVGQAEIKIQEHVLETQPVFEQIRTEQRVTNERLKNQGLALERIEKKLDE